MEDLLYSCSICHGHVLFEDLATPPGASLSQVEPARKFYCPHCEMLVEPVITSAEERKQEGVASRDAATENHGRTRESGSNAGGSQRGDISDEGASQWRADPLNELRNSWEDKPLRKTRASPKR